tara:strand:+ start:7981 stop:8496 length:516 start_codon:yes stop_codon:yes gene_type:complete
MKCLLLSLLIVTCVGCTSTERISKSSNQIQQDATASLNRFETIAAAAPPPHNTTAVGGIEEQERIIAATQQIHTYLTGVEDKVPEWVYLLEYLAIGLISLLVLLILWYTGIGPLIRTIFGWIPRAKRRDASLAVDVLSDSDPADIREYFAARRASDQEFDKAYEKARRART